MIFGGLSPSFIAYSFDVVFRDHLHRRRTIPTPRKQDLSLRQPMTSDLAVIAESSYLAPCQSLAQQAPRRARHLLFPTPATLALSPHHRARHGPDHRPSPLVRPPAGRCPHRHRTRFAPRDLPTLALPRSQLATPMRRWRHHLQGTSSLAHRADRSCSGGTCNTCNGSWRSVHYKTTGIVRGAHHGECR